jgi:hypothetical protein
VVPNNATWAGVSQPLGYGRWEGVMLKGDPKEEWPIGAIPFSKEEP